MPARCRRRPTAVNPRKTMRQPEPSSPARPWTATRPLCSAALRRRIKTSVTPAAGSVIRPGDSDDCRGRNQNECPILGSRPTSIRRGGAPCGYRARTLAPRLASQHRHAGPGHPLRVTGGPVWADSCIIQQFPRAPRRSAGALLVGSVGLHQIVTGSGDARSDRPDRAPADLRGVGVGQTQELREQECLAP